jgi:hypothetical protein
MNLIVGILGAGAWGWLLPTVIARLGVWDGLALWLAGVCALSLLANSCERR